ncbi:OprO/OprP family phosphate-selective porin [Solimonas flava]|uniref:OprO/OprP family phosphate-selective porin n=1 Tax=Solimonas flava TaxID=415849 RepID=UPI000429A349|nr:porin [Solimonas flava]
MPKHLNTHIKRSIPRLSVVPLLAAAVGAQAQEAPSTEQLDQRIRVLERQLEIQKEESDARAKAAATVSASEKGFSIKSAKGDYEFKFRGLLQADSRWYFGDQAPRTNDGFLLRRVEPTFELTLGKSLFFRIQPNFAPDSATVSDVYGELRLSPAFNIRAGKFKAPVVLENLQASAAIEFNERGFPNELGPNRDYGVQLGGTFLSGTTSYAIGVFNGAPDGRDGKQQPDSDNRKELAARLFAEPFKNDPGFFQGLGFGVGASYGDKQGSAEATQLKYRSPGQNTFFSYRAATGSTVGYDGAETRISPQAYFYRNGFGLLAEYIVARQEVVLGASREKLDNKAWQAVASYVLTGEDASFSGLGKPKNPIDKGGFGAWELVARYGVLDIDDDAFPIFADPSKSASKATTWAAGANWYPVNNLKVALSYAQTGFDGGAASGDREDEKLLLTRFQIAF